MAQFNSPGAVVSTAAYEPHRRRRKAENNFFSKRSIVALEPLIYQQVGKLCGRLEKIRDSKTPLQVNCAMLCFTGDVVSRYVFGESWGLLDTPDFAPWMLSANKMTGELSHAMKQWPWLVHVFNSMPISWLTKMAPDIAKIMNYQSVSRYRMYALMLIPLACSKQNFEHSQRNLRKVS